MEPERRKIFKKKIKKYWEPETPEKVKKRKTIEQNKNQGDSTRLQKKVKTVTVLGSTSYMEQNKDLLVMQPLERETITQCQENILQTKDAGQLQNKNAPVDNFAIMNNKTPEKTPQAKKENEVSKLFTFCRVV